MHRRCFYSTENAKYSTLLTANAKYTNKFKIYICYNPEVSTNIKNVESLLELINYFLP